MFYTFAIIALVYPDLQPYRLKLTGTEISPLNERKQKYNVIYQ